jgi:hypothetical protein
MGMIAKLSDGDDDRGQTSRGTGIKLSGIANSLDLRKALRRFMLD